MAEEMDLERYRALQAAGIATGGRRGIKARGRPPERGRMNRLEEEYSAALALRLHAGDIGWFAFEAVKLRLAAATFYIPDFAVVAADGVLEMHETKGFWEEDARVKIKVAAMLYPFRFFGVKKVKGAGWVLEAF